MYLRKTPFCLGLVIALAFCSRTEAQTPPPVRVDSPAEAQEFYRLKRAPAGEIAIPVERYFAALDRMRVMPQHSTVRHSALPSRAELAERGLSHAGDTTEAQALGAWSQLGPGNVGGRTRALVIDPVNPKTMFAAGVAGGVWKSVNGGLSWKALDDLMANLAVSSLVLNPSNPKVIYAGTGEGYFNTDGVRGAGVFRSSDGGVTWSRLAATNTADFYYVNDLAVSAKDPRRLYAATRSGVWRSLDSGAAWTRVLDPKVNGGCLDLALRTDKAGDSLIASCGTLEGSSAVWLNVKAEKRNNWQKVLSENGMGRTTLAIAPSRQDVVYAMAASNVVGPEGHYLYGLFGVFRSNDGGRTWSARVRNTDPKKLSTLLLSNPVYAFAESCFETATAFLNQGWYDNVIAVDPVNPDRVWAGGIDLFRSDDGGKSWGLASYWWANPGTPTYVHADQHVLVFHPRYNGTTVKTLFVGNDGGLFRTRDALAPMVTAPAGVCVPTAGRVHWEAVNNGYAVTQFYNGAPYPDGSRYLGGTQDNGTVRGGQATGSAWETLQAGDGGYVAVDPRNTDVLYVSYVFLSLSRSKDGGETLGLATDGIDEPYNQFLFIAPYAMDPSNPDRLWTGGYSLWRTENGAYSWSQASSRLSGRTPSVSALAVSPADSNRVLAGTREGLIASNAEALSTGEETAWTEVKPRNGWVSSLAFDPHDPNVAYATYSTFGGVHVWKSLDGGRTWAGLDGIGDNGAGRIPDLPVHVLAVDPGNSQHLYLGTDLGIFVSTDGGAHWNVENTGFANVATESLAFLDGPGGSRTLFAFTHGRGAWKVAIED
jgi:photosystem II stability/assembly factor-like uncharacterized protein